MSVSIIRKVIIVSRVILIISLGGFNFVFAQDDKPSDEINISDHFFNLLLPQDEESLADSLAVVEDNWDPSYFAFALEIYPYTRDAVSREILTKLIKQTAKGASSDGLHEWYFWLWNQDIKPAAGYAEFKADMFRSIDLKFGPYFRDRSELARIRLDEIRLSLIHI